MTAPRSRNSSPEISRKRSSSPSKEKGRQWRCLRNPSTLLTLALVYAVGVTRCTLYLINVSSSLKERVSESTLLHSSKNGLEALQARQQLFRNAQLHHEYPQLTLEQWQQIQQKTVSMQEFSTMECDPLPDGGIGVMVWAYDEPPDADRFLRSISNFPANTRLRIYCGSTTCMERANRIRIESHSVCTEIVRLHVLELAAGTPLQEWAEHHVLAKILAAHHFEDHLQVAMQMMALWKHGGVLVQPGVQFGRKATQANLEDHVGSCGASSGSSVGGFWTLVGQQYSPTLKTMMYTFLDRYSSFKPIRERYNPAQWPLYFDLESLVARNTVKPLDSKSCPRKAFVDGRGGPAQYFGTLSYDERRKYLLSLGNPGMNMGDETQGLAGIQVLPRLDAFVERDSLDVVKFTNNKTKPLGPEIGNVASDDGRRVHTFFNAWWGTKSMVWPPPSYIEPVTLSMHFQPKIQDIILEQQNKAPPAVRQGVPASSSFSMEKIRTGLKKLVGRTEESPTPEQSNDIQVATPYLKSQEPIGARDTKTLEFLRTNGVNALFSACLTMTLSLPPIKRDGGVLIVDVKDKEQLEDLVPASVLASATILTQKLLGADAEDGVRRFILAFERLLAYSRANLVITNRLHVALPSVALGAPVVFVHGKTLPGGGGNRMDGLDGFMHAVWNSSDLPPDFDWSNPPSNPKKIEFQNQVKRIRQLSTCHDGLSDSTRKFGFMPPDWRAGEEEMACTRESAWSSDPGAIHIATTLDSNFFSLVFPSWLNALAKSNGDEKIVLYILTVNLSSKQRCLLRLMVMKMLPNAKVFTIPTSVSDFEESYSLAKRGHVPIATQARLRLPSIIPCVRNVLWLDLDAFVVGPLRELWNQPTGQCGVSARNSVGRYMHTHVKPSLMKWHEMYGESFNAGVLLLNLERLRETKFEETIVAYWSLKHGANDQVAFNLACNSTHHVLDEKMNVFQGRSNDVTPPYNEWVIAHFQSGKKPWSENWDPEWSAPGFKKVWENNRLTFEEVLDM